MFVVAPRRAGNDVPSGSVTLKHRVSSARPLNAEQLEPELPSGCLIVMTRAAASGALVATPLIEYRSLELPLLLTLGIGLEPQ
jgi:hypothetical protein